MIKDSTDISIHNIVKEIVVAAINSGNIPKYSINSSGSADNSLGLNINAICKAYKQIYDTVTQ